MSKKYLLVSDLDDTLLGDDIALATFASEVPKLGIDLELIYSSGRTHDSIRESIHDTDLPDPRAIISDVGTEIHEFPCGSFVSAWKEKIADGWDANRVRQVFACRDELQLQPDHCQSDLKVSYFIRDATQEQLDVLKAELTAAGLKFDCIYSSARDLDFLPSGANKGTSAEFIARFYGYTPDTVFVSGNSGNDARFFEHGFQGIIVGNAHDELKEFGRPRSAYIADSGYAAGVLEGIRHWLDQK